MTPYDSLPEQAFWKLAVANKSMFDIDNLWNPKFDITPTHNVTTFGSCFAQHIGNALKSRGFKWLITEKPPYGISEKNAKNYNYNIFSSRTGNIYTTSLLKQWVEWALSIKNPSDEVWIKNDRYYDPFRPRIEPNGFESEDELRESQAQTMRSFKECIQKSDYFVFTLGLTESWKNKKTGFEYPMCPGTVAGEFNPTEHQFENQQFSQVIKNLREAIRLMREENKNLKFILTVSPVPLTATNSGNNVLVATMESKSILRAVAGQLSSNINHVDYFPSYEIINSPVFKGAFFEPNQRSVNPYGVNFVMDSFFNSLQKKFNTKHINTNKAQPKNKDVICEEELLEAFGK